MFNFSERIQEFLEEIIADVLERSFMFISEILFSQEGLTGFFQEVYNVFLAFGAILMVCIILFRLIQTLIAGTAGDIDQSDIGELVLRTMKACIMIPVLPMILWFVVGQIVYPLGEFFFSRLGTFSAESVSDVITSGSIGELIGSQFMFLIIFAFLAVAIFTYFLKMCIYHADVLFLAVFSIFAAISITAEDNNYAGVWWRELLSQVTTIVAQTMAMVGVTEILSGDMTWFRFMLLIGLGVMLIRGPSVLRTMWYATGAGRGAMNQGSKMAARAMLLKKLVA